jgi:dihydroxyacid dehydratase/phosphogluconate dehydratase
MHVCQGNLKPFGKYVMEHVHQIGGVESVMAMLLQASEQTVQY